MERKKQEFHENLECEKECKKICDNTSVHCDGARECFCYESNKKKNQKKSLSKHKKTS